jgi:hypothetical protein
MQQVAVGAQAAEADFGVRTVFKNMNESGHNTETRAMQHKNIWRTVETSRRIGGEKEQKEMHVILDFDSVRTSEKI